MDTDQQCKWVTSSDNRCSNNILMDGFCTRHLKQKCSICMEDVRSTNSANTKRLTCGHAFHYKCIIRWFSTSDDCPTCRKKQIADPLIQFKQQVEEEMRLKYRDAIRSLEVENQRLNETLRRNLRNNR